MRQRLQLMLVCVLLAAAPARAVIFYSTADPAHNTTAPTGSLAGSGWQWQGVWGNFLGTPIGPNHFIAATHVGGNIGGTFRFNGVAHTTVAKHTDAGSDLTIWEVMAPFADWAQLYTNATEVGQNFVVIGRGTQRGASIEVGGPLTPITKGWGWGAYDGIQRWGENTVEDIFDADGNPHSVLISGVVATGPLLRATFDANAGPNECALSIGDSSGAAFIKDGETWRLAGINYAVDGPYNTSATGSGFMAAIFDEGGLYKGGENRWTLTSDLPTAQPGAFYMTRISARLGWIRSIIGDPGVPSPAPILEYCASLNGLFTQDTNAVYDAASKQFRTPNANQQRFFRIRAAAEMEISSLAVEGANLVLTCRYR